MHRGVWDAFGDRFKDSNTVITPDLPGFGKSPILPSGFSLAQVAVQLIQFVEDKAFNNCVLIGHSLGGYVALAVEFKDHVVVLEGGQSEARGLAVIEETKKVIPNKPIRYVVNTHAHFDHASGLAPFAGQGITIITHDNNKSYLEKALGAPRTLVGDTLAKSNKKPKVESAGSKRVLKDDTRTIELHHIENLAHSNGQLVGYLPKEKILFTADFNIPAQGQPVSPFIGVLVQNVERLKLDFDRHVLVHAPNPDRPVTRADLLALAKQ